MLRALSPDRRASRWRAARHADRRCGGAPEEDRAQPGRHARALQPRAAVPQAQEERGGREVLPPRARAQVGLGRRAREPRRRALGAEAGGRGDHRVQHRDPAAAEVRVPEGAAEPRAQHAAVRGRRGRAAARGAVVLRAAQGDRGRRGAPARGRRRAREGARGVAAEGAGREGAPESALARRHPRDGRLGRDHAQGRARPREAPQGEGQSAAGRARGAPARRAATSFLTGFVAPRDLTTTPPAPYLSLARACRSKIRGRPPPPPDRRRSTTTTSTRPSPRCGRPRAPTGRRTRARRSATSPSRASRA